MATPSPNDPGREQLLRREYWSNKPPPVGPTVQPDPRVTEALRARAAAARAAAAAAGGGAGAPPAPPPASPPAASPLSAGSGRLRGLGQAIGGQMQRPSVKAAGRLGSAGLAVHHGAQAIDGFQNAETGADRFAAGYQALRSAAAAGAAAGNPVAGAFTGASVAGDIIGNALPQRAQDFIGAGVNDIVTGAGALFGRDWNAGPRGMPAQPPQLRNNVAASTAAPAGANAAAPTAVPAGANVPTPPPGFEGMQMGRIYRDGNSFSGWGDPNAQANTRTLLTTAAQTGNMQGLTPLQQRQAQMLRDGGTIDSHGNIMTRQTQENLARFAAQDAAAAAAQRQPVFQAGAPVVNQRWEALQKAKAAGVFQQRVNETGRNYRARMNEMASVLGLDMADLGNERSNATSRANTVDSVRAQIETNRASNETSLRTNQLTNQTTRRGQDLEAQERQLAREATLRERQANAQLWQEAGGNANVAADLALSRGLDPSRFLGVAETAQGLAADNRESALQRFESFMPTDDEGNITEAGRASVMAAVDKAFPGFFQLSQPEQAEHFPSVAAQLQILQGANETRDAFTWPAVLGGSRGRPALTAPPANLPGGELRNANIWEMMSSNVDAGDYTLRTGSGQRIFLPRERVDQNVLSELARQGVDVRQIPR